MRVAVIGLGKLGAPLAALLANSGTMVVGVDVSARAVELLALGVAPVDETGLQAVLDGCSSRLTATTDVTAAVAGADATCIIVPTPSASSGEFSIDFVLAAIEQVGAALRCHPDAYHVVLIVSTVMPGATDGPIRAALERASGRRVGRDVGLVYSPEFIALGSVIADMQRPDMVLIGESDARAGDLAERLLTSIVLNEPTIQRMSPVNAEITKISVNAYVTMKISFANMLAELCESVVGGDVDVVLNALGADERIGNRYLKGRTAYGGPCFPRDNVALAAYALRNGVEADLPLATDRVNERQHQRLLDAVLALLPKVDTAAVAVLGLSYKPGTGVVECAAGLRLAAALAEKGLDVRGHDPKGTSAAAQVLGGKVRLFDAWVDAVAGADVVVVTTPWPEYDDIVVADGTDVVDVWRQVRSGAVINLGVGPAPAEEKA